VQAIPGLLRRSFAAAVIAIATLLSGSAPAATFTPANVAQLIADINTANANGADDVIDLGGLSLTLTVANNGSNGLPVLTSDGGHTLTIQNGTIERDAMAPAFRILEVAADASVTLTSMTIRNGAASGILNQGSLVIATSTLADNTGVDGGAIQNTGTLEQVSASTFTGNLSTNQGGAISSTGRIAVMFDCTISGNTTTVSGGGLWIGGSGAGLILFNTVTGNSALQGAGITNAATIDSLIATLVAGNLGAPGALDILNNGTITDEHNNLVGDNSGSTLVAGSPNANNSYVGTAASPIDPQLGPLANNGGPTLTHLPAPTSLAIDHGITTGTVLDDQRLLPRVSGPTGDIGAVEVQYGNDIGVTKLDSPDPVNPGANITYTITVSNAAGGHVTEAVTLTDALPAGTTFVSLSTPAGWSCSMPAVGGTGTVTCSNATFAIGNGVFTLVVAVDGGVAVNTVISNTATVTSTLDPNAMNDSATATTTVVGPSADLAVTKVDTPDPVSAGANLTYTINITNNGPNDAASVSLSDTLPAGTTFVSLSSPAGWSCTTPAVGGTGTVSCSMATLAPGTGLFTLVVAVGSGVPGGTVITNTATVAGATTDPNLSNQSATTTTTVVGLSADVAITKVDTPDPVSAGANLTYTINITNNGPNDAASVSLSDTLPANTTFVSLSSPAGWSCTTPAVGGTGTVSCSLPTLAPGTGAFTLVVAVGNGVAAGTVITNTATVATTTTDPNLSNQSATATTTVAGSADLSVTKTVAPGPVTVGSNLAYTITVVNGGPSAAAAASLSDALPPGTTFVSLTSPGGWSCTTPAVGAGGTVTCINASFAPGNAAFNLVVNVGAAVPGGSSLTNTATVTSATTDPDPANQTATATTFVLSPATVTATKTVEPAIAIFGGTLTYTVVLTNGGASPQQDNPGDEFTDVLPASLTLVSATATSGTATTAGNTVHWNGSIAAGGSVTITITAAVNTMAVGVTIANQGSFNFDADGNGTNESSGVTDDPTRPGAADATEVTTRSVAIPTLGATGMLLLMLAMAALAMGVLQRARSRVATTPARRTRR